MKTTLVAAMITVALAGCSATAAKQSVAEKTTPRYNTQPVTVASLPSANDQQLITMEKIMSDPDWIGRAPESWYWGDTSGQVFFKQKRVGSPVRDLFQLDVSTNTVNAVAADKLHVFSDNNAVRNAAGTQEVYSFSGDLFLKTLASQQVTQLTHTVANEYYPKFLNDGRIVYQTGNSFFALDLASGSTVELVQLVEADAPKAIEAPSGYLAQEQHKLIKFVAGELRDKQLQEDENNRQQSLNPVLQDNRYYFGKDSHIAMASLSPAGNKLIVSVSKKGKWNNDTDIMPNYVASDGNIEAKPVRRRVADNRQYSEELYLIDLERKQKTPLSFVNLPGYNDDVLADVRKENYARQGKTYQVNRLPRNIALMAAWKNIDWNKQGDQVAVLLEAWDNKDRWLVTVDFAQSKLVTQHRLHDNAWINYTHNEFGWLSSSNSLYYLSEESGYSHLYVKPLSGEAKALTQGNYVVSNLTVSQDESQIYYQANANHPGIYEIYRVNVANGKSEAMTQLGGMNEYALSPDEQFLLIEHSEVLTPPDLYLQPLDGGTARQLTDTVSDEFKAMPWTAPTVVAVPSSHTEQPIYAKVYLPKGETTDKQKAVMFVHGAGYLQNSHLGWSGYFREFMFHSLLTQKGYVVMDMDYRASKGYGRDWRTAIYRHMGKPEVEDLRDGVNWLVNNADVDGKRVGVYGGSYGGFLTLMSLFTDPELFQSGAALRLVSDWAYYNHGYTANILNTPEDDSIAYERSSPIYFAEGLNKPLLINAPMVDDNVFFQDSVRLVQRLIELEKENFETAIFPVEPHGFKQPSSWLDEYRRILKLFESTL